LTKTREETSAEKTRASAEGASWRRARPNETLRQKDPVLFFSGKFQQWTPMGQIPQGIISQVQFTESAQRKPVCFFI
jgi:hypothetical protein